MNILFVMPTHISYGGIESVAINLWKSFQKRGHFVDFVCHGSQVGAFEPEILAAGANVYHIPTKGKDCKGAMKAYEAIVKSKKYDVVHTHMNATCGLYLEIARNNGVKALAAHSHASSLLAITRNPAKLLVNQVEKARTNRWANIRIACSAKAGRWLFGSRPFHVIANAIDMEDFYYSEEARTSKRAQLGIADEAFAVCHIGNFVNYKNHGGLLDIFCEIRSKRENACLLLAGDGALRPKIERAIKSKGLEGSVKLLGRRKDVNEILQAADVFLLPSYSEGNPVSVAEAATAGLHCLVSDQVARDTARYFKKGAIEFLPIRGKAYEKLWARRALSPFERVPYSQKNPPWLTMDSMAAQVEKLYEQKLRRNEG